MTAPAPDPRPDPHDPHQHQHQEPAMTTQDDHTTYAPSRDAAPDRTPDPADVPDDVATGTTGTTGTTETTGTAVAAVAAERPARAGIRSGTVVWGLVLAAIGVGLLAAAAGLEFDVQLALIVLIGVAGLALLLSSLTGARRRR